MTHMTRPTSRHLRRLLAVVLGLSLVAAACGDDDGNGEEATEGATECDTVSIGWIPWDEDIAVTHLWRVILEDEGVEVELTQSDVGPVFQGVAQGDLDLFLDAWLPSTHEDYWAEHSNDLEDLATWYDQGVLTIAVPDYVDEVQSIGDLADNVELFDGRIIGIEPGAGLTRITQDEAIPTYGLDSFELVEGSTPAMLAELERAVSNEDPIVVTLWRPHWAYATYPIRDLEDPENAMGDAEELHAVARSGFSSDCPTISGWISNFEMTDEGLASLSELVINEYGEGREDDAVREWLSDPANQQMVDSWKS